MFPSGTSMRKPPGWIAEAQRRLELQGLTVDAGVGLARAGAHLEGVAVELDSGTRWPSPGRPGPA